MSCDVAMAAYLLLASTGPSGPAPAPAIVTPVSAEPLFADIVGRAGRLKSQVDGFRSAGDLAASAEARPLPGLSRFDAEVRALAALDMQGHLELAKRGTDGDLKCILKGISQDLPLKLLQVEQAPNGAAEDKALRDMAYLLNDNVEVITAPPAPPV